jgi:hypothetical protein
MSFWSYIENEDKPTKTNKKSTFKTDENTTGKKIK